MLYYEAIIILCRHWPGLPAVLDFIICFDVIPFFLFFQVTRARARYHWTPCRVWRSAANMEEAALVPWITCRTSARQAVNLTLTFPHHTRASRRLAHLQPEARGTTRTSERSALVPGPRSLASSNKVDITIERGSIEQPHSNAGHLYIDYHSKVISTKFRDAGQKGIKAIYIYFYNNMNVVFKHLCNMLSMRFIGELQRFTL